MLHRAAAAGVERVAAGRRVVVAEPGAQLHRHRGDAADVVLHLHDVIGLREGAVGRLLVAEQRVDEDVVGHLVPHHGGAGLDGRGGLDDERQLLVFDLDRLGGVHRLGARLRHHHRQRLADMARLVGRQQMMRPDEHRAAARRAELHVVFGRRHRRVRDRLEPVGANVRAGEHAEHAGHRFGLRGVDAHDARVRVRRAHHRRVGLSVEAEVVGEAALAGEQPLIFLAAQRLADGVEGGAVRNLDVFVHVRRLPEFYRRGLSSSGTA